MTLLLSFCLNTLIVVHLCCSFALLVVIIVTCVLVNYYFHHHRLHLAGGKLVVLHIVIHLSLPSTHQNHLTLLVMLLICHVISVIIHSLCCLCHGDVLPLPISLSKWWSFPTIKKRKKIAYAYKKSFINYLNIFEVLSVNACILGYNLQGKFLSFGLSYIMFSFFSPSQSCIFKIIKIENVLVF